MALLGSSKIIAYTSDEEEETVTSGNVARRYVQRETHRQEYDGGAVVRTKQFTQTASFRLTNIDSKLRAPDFNYGDHEESYILEGGVDDHNDNLMAVVQLQLKDNFRPAQPVSASWYNLVAKTLKKLYPGESGLSALPGYDAGATQALMNVNGVIQWVTVEECA